ncbi:MAG: hypothetical protein EAX89_13025 [Candidatus Lokiarchaeota archaeon]|nr:hypothetical protein [Candidatus Lokiarchaeota archaeon]
MINKKLLQWLNLITFIAVVIINYLAISLPLGYGSTQQLSDDIPNLFVPAGLTFSIWGIIYILLGIFSVYQLRDIFKSEKIEMPYLGKISYIFIISNVANFSWILLWHYKLVLLSLVAMLIILISLILIYIRLDIGKNGVSRTEKIAVHAPFSVYLGWITVATIANVTAVLVVSGVESFGLLPELLTVLVLVVAVIITYLMLFLRKDWVYSLVIVWAVLGIYLKQSGLNTTVSITALVAVIVVAIGIVYTGLKLLRK